MKILKTAALYIVPLISILIFGYYATLAGGGEAWATKHGIHAEIGQNYRLVNSVTLLGWVATLALLVLRKPLTACLPAAFATGYLVCDIVFYIPMARVAGEPFPFDQFVVAAIQAVWVLLLFRSASREAELR
ncbi:hypothetical protein [Phenylobacterium sp.]|jgi:hypothetical protein|uniref:hypothetical protein n=1 Tax=Phenylobacterium sp. TaxID=1871053 RepID=UPI003785094F